jgi:hypothetical protein
VLVRMWGKRSPHTLLWLQVSTTSLENNTESS